MRVTNNVNFNAAANKIRAAIALYGQSAALKMESAAKNNAPWTDRTSNARNSIQGQFSMLGNTARITISGNTDYFVFLELANEKRWAVLSPTLESYAADVIAGYQKVVK